MFDLPSAHLRSKILIKVLYQSYQRSPSMWNGFAQQAKFPLTGAVGGIKAMLIGLVVERI